MRASRDEGQATAEFGIILPLVVAAMLTVLQVGLVVADQVLVTHAAREAVRAASLEADPEAPVRAARSAAPLAAGRLRVEVGERGRPGSLVTVRLTYRPSSRMPLLNRAVARLELTAEATMRVER